MLGVLKALPLLLIVGLPAFAAGFSGHRLLGLLWAATLVLLAVITTANEPDNYDMPGFGLYVFGSAAGLAVLSLITGIAARSARQRRALRKPRQ